MGRQWGWFQPRRYQHFDYPVSAEQAARVATSPADVVRHAFYPFISIQQKTPRYKPKEGKTRAKVRPIRYAAHADSAIFSYYAKLLGDAYERRIQAEAFSASVIAYRKLDRKTNIHFAADAFAEIRRMGNCVAIGLDIESFFDRLDHGLLKVAWAWTLGVDALPPDHFAVFKHVTRYAYVDKGRLDQLLTPFPSKGRLCSPEVFREVVRPSGIIEVNRKDGIPQGSPISAVLANIYMHALDRVVHAAVAQANGKYYRYADDILILVPGDREAEARHVLEQQIAGLRLAISHSKTVRVNFRRAEGVSVKVEYPRAPSAEDKRALQYLGFIFDGQRVLVRSASLARYWRSLKAAVHIAKRVAHASESKRVYRRKLYRRFTHLGTRTFYTYVRSASEVFGVPFFARQLRRHWSVLQHELARPD